MILFKTVKDIYEAQRLGFPIVELQIGGLGGGPGRTNVLNQISLDQTDAELLKEVQAKGTHVYLHVLPTEPKVGIGCSFVEDEIERKNLIMDSNFGMALTAGYYFIGHCKIGYWFYDVPGQPLFIGMIFGLVSGDLKTGLMLGGTIQLVYLGMIMPGGNLPSDPTLASVIAIPIALKTGLTAEQAVVLAVPLEF